MAGGGPGTDVGPLLHGRVSPRYPVAEGPPRTVRRTQPERHAHRPLAGAVPGWTWPGPWGCTGGGPVTQPSGSSLPARCGGLRAPRTARPPCGSWPGRPQTPATAVPRPETARRCSPGPGDPAPPGCWTPSRTSSGPPTTGRATSPCTRCFARPRHAAPRLLRVGRSGRVLEALVPAVLEQKVLSMEAHRAWRILLAVRRPAAGPRPGGMRVFRRPRTWAAHPVLGLAPGRGGRRPRPDIIGPRGGDSLEGMPRKTPARPTACCGPCPASGPGRRPRPGSAPAGTRTRCPSATRTCRTVGWALAGRAADDAGMLELLAP